MATLREWVNGCTADGTPLDGVKRDKYRERHPEMTPEPCPEPPVRAERQPATSSPRVATVTTTPPATGGPCVYRSELVTRIDKCDLCGNGMKKGQPFQIYWCALHAGDCSLARHHSQVRSCGVCQATGDDQPAMAHTQQ